MYLRIMDMRARVSLISALGLFASSLFFPHIVTASEENPAVLSEGLNSMPTDTAENIRQLVLQLQKLKIPTSSFEQKLQEGLTKKIAPQQIFTVLARMADNLLWLNEQTAACVFFKIPDRQNTMLNIGNDALLGALTRNELLSAIQIVCGANDGVERFEQVFELFSYATNRLRANKTAAWPFALAVLSRQESKATMNSLVLALQEIFKARGNIDSVLVYATARLQKGVALRTTTNELKEQFLRQ